MQYAYREQWCRSLLSIAGDNLQFYSNSALFSTLGGMNLDHDFDQMNLEHFFPQIQVKTKKKVFTKNRTLPSPKSGKDQKKKSSSKIEHFFLKSTFRCTPIQIIGEMQMWTILKLMGGYSQIFGSDISPHPSPCFGTPDREPSHQCTQ